MDIKPQLVKHKYLLAVPIIAVLLVFAFNIGITYGYNRNANISMGFNLNPPVNEYGVKSEVLGVHTDAWVTRVSGETEYLGHHAGLMTTIGFDNVQDQLFDIASPSLTKVAYYGSLSNDTSGTSSAYTIIPGEIVTGGLERSTMTYTRTSATVCTLDHQWTATAANAAVQLVGFNWGSSGDNNLMWNDIFTPVSLQIGDKLTVTATITLS